MKTLLRILTGLSVVAAGEAAAQLPKDPCALITPAEIQALAPGAKVGAGKPDMAAAPMGVACSFSWGPRTKEWGETSVSVTVMDGSKAYPGTNPDVVAQGLAMNAKSGRDN